jgi:hypothetical protein
MVFMSRGQDPNQIRIQDRDRAEIRMEFSDRRIVSGVPVPFNITTTARRISTGQSNTQQIIRLESAEMNVSMQRSAVELR